MNTISEQFPTPKNTVVLSTKSKSLTLFVASSLALSSITGIGIYYWQNSLRISTEQQLLKENYVLKNEIESLKNTLNVQRKSNSQKHALSPSESKAIIEKRANEAILAIKNRNGTKLSELTNPELGIRFSPYSYVDTENNLIFQSYEIKNLFADSTKYYWGNYDGSGFPIELTFEEYYKKFIYDKDFLNAPQISFNETITRGNSINNSLDVYPYSNIVEYHFPVFESKYDGMDWVSLRLVFQQYQSSWYLVGIIHDQWTI